MKSTSSATASEESIGGDILATSDWRSKVALTLATTGFAAARAGAAWRAAQKCPAMAAPATTTAERDAIGKRFLFRSKGIIVPISPNKHYIAIVA
ncbi:hypothetical protein CCAX7_16700 [Capsulimonas corticalis]|uniref:Uncharacterized protein n=1 Tax=Capsulimonas corticalis TaxID=2219043 RepID=A0A402CYW8_9BACT|nr:hypothetical protein CCAX7_16700 [Capsulimonas corticalis]